MSCGYFLQFLDIFWKIPVSEKFQFLDIFRIFSGIFSGISSGYFLNIPWNMKNSTFWIFSKINFRNHNLKKFSNTHWLFWYFITCIWDIFSSFWIISEIFYFLDFFQFLDILSSFDVFSWIWKTPFSGYFRKSIFGNYFPSPLYFVTCLVDIFSTFWIFSGM